MSRSNYDKPFYVDVGTSVAAIRCASDGEVVDFLDHHGRKDIIKLIEDYCARMNQEAERFYVPTSNVAAIEREHHFADGSKMGGNTAAMREAVKKVLDAVKHLSRTHNDDLPEDVRVVLGGIAFDANAALSSPPRNCDVGTAVEQSKRMEIYCKAHGTDESGCYRCESCIFLRTDRCELAWSQMPYEAKKGGAE